MASVGDYFRPETKNILGLFSGYEDFYKIPEYQRPYSWGEEQVEQLWDDIYSAYKEGEDHYFLGPMVLIREGNEEKPYFEVIDGQQRLVTLTILFCVLRDFYLCDQTFVRELHDKKLPELIEHAIKYLGRYRITLITQAHHHMKFKNSILEGIKPKQLERDLRRLKDDNRFLFIARKLKERLEELYEKGGIEEVENFIKYLLYRVIVIRIICSNFTSAIRLFQTLNTRGLDLTPADIIKSFLYSKCRDEDEKHIFIDNWSKIEEAVSKMAVGDLSTILTMFLYYRLAPTRPRRAINEEFERFFKEEKSTVEDIVYDIKEFVDSLEELERSQNKIIYELSYLPNKIFWRTILATAIKEGYPNFEALAIELRNLYYLYWIAGYTTAKTRKLSFDIMALVRERKDINIIHEKVREKIKDDRVIDLTLKNLDEKVYGKRWIRPLLLLIEYERTDEAKLVFIDPSKVDVDRILPEKWYEKPYWRELWSEEDANMWLHKLGNLTIVYGRMNRKVQNEPFKEKLDYYLGRKELGRGEKKLASTILARELEEYEDWTVESVKDRHQRLLSEVKKILRVDEIIEEIREQGSKKRMERLDRC